MIIWTYVGAPFAFGETSRPIGCEVDVGARRSLGGGYYGYAVSTPKGGTVICEETSGAIIGNSLEAVRSDIKTGDPDVMKQQVTHACNELKKATIVPRDNFWDIYCK